MVDFPRTQTEVQTAIEQQLQQDFGDDIDLTESSIFTQLAEVFSTVVANNQEQSLQEVYESAFLDTATGEDLEAVVALAGITRRSATSATGVERFSTGDPTTANRVIQNGTTIQTEGTDTIEFETTERTVVQLFDDFEESDTLNDYEGDVGDASLVSNNVYNGLSALELAAVDSSHIYNPNHSITRGSDWSYYVRLTADTAPTSTWAVQTLQDHYQVVVDDATNELRLEEVSGGAITSLDTATVDPPTQQYLRLDHEWTITGDITVTLVDESTDPETELATVSDTDNFTYLDGPVGFKSSDANGVKQFDDAAMSAASTNIRAIESGTVGNVGAQSITSLSASIAGITDVRNLYPTGDTDYLNTDGLRFINGDDAETDEELRNRAEESVSEGGAATADAILSDLINNVDGVTSVTIYENKTDTDNTGSGGLPPFSFEAVVFGGDSFDIAESIYDNKAVTATDYGGANGTEVTETVVSDVNEQSWDISFSRPIELSIDVTVDIIINTEYVGDAKVKDSIVSYIGGVQSGGGEVTGLDVSQNVRIDRLRDSIVNDEFGVVGLDYSVDGDPLETTPTKATVDGLEVIEVSDTEVAQTDATDGSITINTREQ